jgi:predicted esterase
MRLHRTAVGVAALVVALSACGLSQQVDRINGSRSTAGQPALPQSTVLNGAAGVHAHEMCTAQAVSASPAGSYRQETATAIHELVGAATPDPSLAAGIQEAQASGLIWNQWHNDPALTDPKWTDMGIGEDVCANGTVYMTAVLRQGPTMPATGLYVTPQYDASAIVVHDAVPYTTAPDASGTVGPLVMDIFTPPGPVVPRPTVIVAHPGAFSSGDRSQEDSEAMEWARRGFVGVSFDYRLSDPAVVGANEIAVVAATVADSANAVRFMKANAATYGVDPDRVAMIGHSAGGALALATGVTGATATSGPLAGFSSQIAAAVSVGAYLTPGLGAIPLNANEAATMMIQYEQDTATHVTSAYAFETCDALRAAGNTCDEVPVAGEGHDSQLVPGADHWDKLGPFIYDNLHLAG